MNEGQLMERAIFALLLLIGLSRCSGVQADEPVYRGAQVVRDGNHFASAVHVDLGDELFPSRVLDMLLAMPRLQTLVIGGPRYVDGDLTRLRRLPELRVLVLDSVDVSDTAIADLQLARPGLTVIRSQRQAIKAIQSIHPEVEIETRLTELHPRLRELLGEQYFLEATAVDFSRLPDDERGPFDRILNEELAPLRQLPTLRRLDLTWTRLNDGGMFYLKSLRHLESLTIPPDEVSADGLRRLRGLSHLVRFDGRVDDDGIGHLAALTTLQSLRIDPSSKLTDEGLKSLAGLTRLRVLSLPAPTIHGRGLGNLSGLTHLVELNLGPGIRDLSTLPELRSLRTLVLTGSEIDDEALVHLTRCRTLMDLSLDHTSIGDDGIQSLKGLSQLRGLGLHNTRVGDAGLIELQQLPMLSSLSLGETQVTNAGLARLSALPKLEHLTLHGLPLDDVGIRNLSGLKSLTSIEASVPADRYPDIASRSEANRKLREQLKAALPDCMVY
jgi:Leucine-rich repeat (LRR) protein